MKSAGRLRSWKGVDSVGVVLAELRGCEVATHVWQQPLELEGECLYLPSQHMCANVVKT